MRDPRLRESWALEADAKRRAATEVRLAAAPPEERAEVDRILDCWWSGVLAQDSLDEQARTNHIEHLRTKCSSLSAEAQTLALAAPSALARDTGDLANHVGARLLGESAARVIRRATTAVELDRAVRFLSDCWEAVEALQDAFSRDPAWPTSTETLALPNAPPIEDLLGHHFDRVPSSSVLIEEESKARERGVSAYFWGQYPELPLNETSLVRLLLVARRKWADLATQADALPLRAFRDWLWLSLHLHEDRDAILALLRAAPPVFATDSWTGSTSALAALRAAVRHAERLHNRLSQATRAYPSAPDAETKLKALEQDELPKWLKQMADTAAARCDGRSLLTLFASTLVRHDLTPPWNGQRSWTASRDALNAIYRALDPKPSLDECQKVAKLAGVPSNRTTIEFATYLVTSAVFDADPKEVWAWYRELLLKNDDDLCWQARSCGRRALCYFALAERLGQLDDPFDEWRAVWNALFVTDRERARFATIDQNALYPSLHLIRVGAELLRQTPSRACAWEFFQELLAHMRTLLATDVRRYSPIPPEIALDALDVGPRIPGAEWSPALDAFRQLLVSTKNRVYVAALLLEGGASFADAEEAVEAAPHRLTDSVAELRSNGADLDARHLCEFVASAAKRHAADSEGTT